MSIKKGAGTLGLNLHYASENPLGPALCSRCRVAAAQCNPFRWTLREEHRRRCGEGTRHDNGLLSPLRCWCLRGQLVEHQGRRPDHGRKWPTSVTCSAHLEFYVGSSWMIVDFASPDVRIPLLRDTSTMLQKIRDLEEGRPCSRWREGAVTAEQQAQPTSAHLTERIRMIFEHGSGSQLKPQTRALWTRLAAAVTN